MKASVLTQHNDSHRTGVNRLEPTLTPANIAQKFKQLRLLAVDPPEEGGPTGWKSQIVGQPLLAADVDFGGGARKDVLVVATMHGTVYAFDATHNNDPNHAYPRLWARWLGPVVQDFPGFDDKDIWGTNPEWGILSTPVIDAVRKVVFAVVWNPDGGGTFRLNALDLTTGAPVVAAQVIQGSVTGPNGNVPFNPIFQKQRPGLLLVRPEDVPPARQADFGPQGTLYIAFGASAEGLSLNGRPSYQGWIFACDAATLAIRKPWCTTPVGGHGGIWQAGQGPAATAEGDVVVLTGDGHSDGHNDFGQSAVKLRGKDLTVLDYFTPRGWRNEIAGDLDLGSAGPIYIQAAAPSNKSFIVGGGKTGKLYVLDAANLGKGGDATKPDNVVDEINATGDPPQWKHQKPPGDHDHHIHGSPVYFAPLQRLFVWGENDVLRAYTLTAQGKFNPRAARMGDVVGSSGMPGGMLSLTSDGDNAPVLWALMPAPAPFDPNNPFKADANRTRLVSGILRAFDAATMKEVWNSNGPGAGIPWHFAKFSPPTVVGGRAYVPTYDGQLVVFGPG